MKFTATSALAAVLLAASSALAQDRCVTPLVPRCCPSTGSPIADCSPATGDASSFTCPSLTPACCFLVNGACFPPPTPGGGITITRTDFTLTTRDPTATDVPDRRVQARFTARI